MYKFCRLLIYQDILYMSITKSKYVTNWGEKTNKPTWNHWDHLFVSRTHLSIISTNTTDSMILSSVG